MARSVSRKGVRFVAGWEGFRPCPYRDAVGVWTIGYGETQGIGPNTPCISKRKARRMMRRRLNRDYARPAWRMIQPRLRRRERDALASFAYNVGLGNVQNSTLRRRLNGPEGRRYRTRKRVWREELPRWTNNGLAGLVKRRAAEVRMAVRGDYSGRP
jgi:lysozyme